MSHSTDNLIDTENRNPHNVLLGEPLADRKWDKQYKVGIILILVIWGGIVFCNLILGLNCPKNRYRPTIGDKLKNSKSKVTFNTTRGKILTPKYQSLQWLRSQDNEFEGTNTVSEDNGLYFTFTDDKYEIRSVVDKDYSKLLFEGKTINFNDKDWKIDSIVASPNLSKLLIKSETVKNWRHSSFGSYFIFDKDNDNNLTHIGDNLALVEWSPNSNELAYVKGNNIYIYSSQEGKTIQQVTDDGSEQIFNGRPDWVYEEEVFANDRTLWWSPNGKFLAFTRINETEVKEFTIPYFVQNENDTYPDMKSIKYPKTGTSNPTIDLIIYNLDKQTTWDTEIYKNDDSLLLTELKWVNSNQIITKVTDRTSDLLKIVTLDVANEYQHVARNESSNGSWWEITYNTIIVPKSTEHGIVEDGYVDILPINGFNHLVYFKNMNDSKPIVLTQGNWEIVDGPIAFDKKLQRIYFSATKKSSMERHIYYVNLNRPGVIHDVTNTKLDGVYSITFSSSCKYALLTYKGPTVPFQKIISIGDVHDKEFGKDKNIHGNVIGKTLYYLEENNKLVEKLNEFELPKKTFKEIKLGQGEKGEAIIVNAIEILPNGFNPKLKNYYPVFFYTYGGPNSQQVLKTFSVGFNDVIASQLNAIVVVVDGRGTGFKGVKFRSMVRGKLGSIEAEDQISAATLYSNRPYVNSEKISLFGWSYGGYLTLKTLEKDAGKTFNYGISVAPVTDWKLYDTVYTERYMSTPQLNLEGYKESRVHDVESIGKCSRFLLMHGTGDDNVHFQNSLILLDELNLKSISNYDVHIFPDSDHGIKYHNANDMIFDRIFEWTRQRFTEN